MNQNQLKLLAFIAALEEQHGKAHPRVRSMAGALGVSERAVQQHLRLLRSAGLVKVSTRRTRSGKQLTSLYTLTDAGRALIAATSPLKQQEAALAAFHTQNEGGRVKQETTSGVQGVKQETASGVKRAEAAETPSGTALQGGRVKQETTSPLKPASPLNKEPHEPTGGEPQESPAHEGRAHEPQPPLTGIPDVDRYILRKHEERKHAPPDPYAWVHELHAKKQREALMAQTARKADA